MELLGRRDVNVALPEDFIGGPLGSGDVNTRQPLLK